ncbi:MAG TPA: hypothetical protein VGM23_01260 [Armatimonadota bacterium]
MPPRKKLATATVATLLLLCAAVLAPGMRSATAATLPTEFQVAQQAQPSFTGMDESVNEKMANEAGRPPRAPFINTERYGDLWNTLLLLVGGVCGFILGRSWPVLFGRKAAEHAGVSTPAGDA